MDLFILRHGKAGKSSYGHDDAARVLTRKEKDEIKEVARWIKLKKFKFDSIATSPLKRAHETTTINASFLGQEDKLTTWNLLAPGGDPDRICHSAARYGKNATVLFIGHEPSLSMLMSKIIHGNGNGSFVLLKRRSGKNTGC